MTEMIFIVGKHIFFDIILPTVDTYSDCNFAIRAFVLGYHGIGISMISPVFVNLFFNICLWKSTDFDSEKERRYSWIVVVLNFWPQYQVVKLLLSIYKGCHSNEWKARQHKIKMQLSYIEPFVEAVPQYFISLCIYTMLLVHSKGSTNLDEFFTQVWKSDDNNKLIQVFGKETLGINNSIMFPITLSLSFFSGVKSVADYLANGPMSMTSDNKVCSIIILLFKWIYVVIEFLNKFVIFWTSSITFIYFGYLILDERDRRQADLAGGLIFTMLFMLCVLIPALIVVGPITRYLGFKKFFVMYFQNPQLLTLPFITDLAFGPSNGYKNFTCCCWCSVCCKIDKGTDISISRGLSWIKMIYSSFLLTISCIILIVIFISNFINNISTGKISLINWENSSDKSEKLSIESIFIGSYLPMIIIGRFAFIIILHAGPRKKFGNLRVTGQKKDVTILKMADMKEESTPEYNKRSWNFKNKKSFSMTCLTSCTVEMPNNKNNSWPKYNSSVYSYNKSNCNVLFDK